MPNFRFLAILFLLLAGLAACDRKEPAAHREPGWAVRLPAEVNPTRYDITITPDPKAMTFRGSAKIAMDVQGEVRKITLNAVDLVIERAVLEDGTTARVTLDEKDQTATLTFPKKVGQGPHDLLIDYRGKINTSSSGLFALDYPTENGGQARMLATQFQSADFRRFVPSWDEPARKAVFQLTVVAPQSQSVVSNMPAARVQPVAGGLKRVTFQPTPKMSTYLMFLAIGDLERVSRNVDGVELGIVTRKGAGERAGYALNAAERFLRYYTDYFGVKYPLPKLDLIAAPGAGSFGAMENWGAILFFEPYLLIDPAVAAESDRQRVEVYISHEIAHMWFGDLVTMAWWDDLWLNESFASWMENKSIEDLHPGWRQELVSLDARETAMRLDATAATHPIVQPAETLEQVNQIGDAITYEKGASIIRMLEAYVGEEAFREGVRAYIKANAYGNARREDLWRAIEAAARKPILRMAKDFTEQAGVPLVRVDPVTAADGAEAVLRQARFGADDASRTTRFWRIPVRARSLAGGPLIDQVLEAGPLVTSIDSAKAGPLVVNYGQSGYFRTLYAQALFDGLARRIGDVQPVDQLALVYDSWALGAAGYAPVANVLELVSRLPLRADPRVWSGALDILVSIDGYYAPGAERDAYRAWAVEVLRPLMDRVGWQDRRGEPAATPILREQLILALGALGDKVVLDEVALHFQRFLDEPGSLAPEIRQAVLDITGEHADMGAFQALRRLAREANDPEAQRQYLTALAAAEDPAIARRVLDLSVTEETPVTLTPVLINRVAGRHPRLAFDFAVAHQKELKGRLDPAMTLSFVPSLVRQSTDARLADELSQYAQRAFPEGGRRESEKVEARVRYRAKVAAERLPEIDRWLQLRQAPVARPAA